MAVYKLFPKGDANFVAGQQRNEIIAQLQLSKFSKDTSNLERELNDFFYSKKGDNFEQYYTRASDIATQAFNERYQSYNFELNMDKMSAKFTNSNVGLLCNFSYYLNEDFTLNHNNIPARDYKEYNLAKYDYEIDTQYILPYETATPTERTFAIDEVGLDEVVVNKLQGLMKDDYDKYYDDYKFIVANSMEDYPIRKIFKEL